MSAKMASSVIFPNIILASSGDIGTPREEAVEESEAVDIRDEEVEVSGVIGVLFIGPDK